MVDEVALIVRGAVNNCEAHIIRGTLQYCSIPSRVCDYIDLDGITKNGLLVILPMIGERDKLLHSLTRCQRPIVFAGRQITLEFLRKRFPVTENEVVIYGEPYVVIREMAKRQELIGELRGKAVLGTLLDLERYRSPPTTNPQMARIMVSQGCQKKCGYCTYGAAYSQLYSEKHLWRSRPFEEIRKDLIDSLNKGVNRIWLMADQLFSRNINDNQALFSLARCWEQRLGDRPKLYFNISPTEVLNNKPILEAMSRSFDIHPRLSVDSFDNSTLDLFDLAHDASTALEAVELLSRLEIPLRINYIFVRPGLTPETIEGELHYFKLVDALTSYLSPQHKLLIAHDLFAGYLRIIPETPIALKIQDAQQYGEKLPLQSFRVISRIQSALDAEIDNFRSHNRGNPLLSVIDAGMEEVSLG